MKTFIENAKKYRWLLYELVKKDLKVKYRRSILGYLWTLLNPLLMMAVMSVVFSYLFRFQIPNYPIYILTGQIMFNFFSEATNTSMISVINNGSLLRKVYVPKYIFPVSSVVSSFIHSLFSLSAIIIMLLVTKTPISFAILLAPLPLFYLLLFSTGIGLILSVLAVYFRDILHLYGVLLMIWMYLTPIFYPPSILPKNILFLLKFNPLYHFVSVFRDIVLYANVPTLRANLVCLGYGLISIAVGAFFFKKTQDKLVLKI